MLPDKWCVIFFGEVVYSPVIWHTDVDISQEKSRLLMIFAGIQKICMSPDLYSYLLDVEMALETSSTSSFSYSSQLLSLA
jgi:hypothetical protein